STRPSPWSARGRARGTKARETATTAPRRGCGFRRGPASCRSPAAGRQNPKCAVGGIGATEARGEIPGAQAPTRWQPQPGRVRLLDFDAVLGKYDVGIELEVRIDVG